MPLPEATPLVALNCVSFVIRIVPCGVYEISAGVGAGGISDDGFDKSERDEAKRTVTINAAIMILRSFGSLCPLDSEDPRSISDMICLRRPTSN